MIDVRSGDGDDLEESDHKTKIVDDEAECVWCLNQFRVNLVRGVENKGSTHI